MLWLSQAAPVLSHLSTTYLWDIIFNSDTFDFMIFFHCVHDMVIFFYAERSLCIVLDKRVIYIGMLISL
jgi:hypothetical protein